jgi:hypothetical protein
MEVVISEREANAQEMSCEKSGLDNTSQGSESIVVANVISLGENNFSWARHSPVKFQHPSTSEHEGEDRDQMS